MSSNPIVEILYFQLYNAYLDANERDVAMYLGLLKEEYKKDKEAMKETLTQKQRDMLKQINSGFQKGILYLTHKFVEEPIETKFQQEKIKEKEVALKLFNNITPLEQVLGIENLHILDLEVPTDTGRCDLVCYTKNTMYPIEFKAGTARVEVAMQTWKYMKHYLKRLCYKVYEDVVGIVIASGFNADTIGELKRLSIEPFIYKLEGKNLKLLRV